MAQRFHNPVAIHYGPASLQELPQLLGAAKVVLVTFPEAASLGLVSKMQHMLGQRLTCIIDNIQPNPDVSNLSAIYEQFWQRQHTCDTIVALGGGSVIDTAKTLMVGTASGSFQELLALLSAGQPFIPAKSKPLIAIPTTAGTGSEVTPWATIWDAGQQKKYSLHLDCTWPKAALIDPDLMLSVPRGVTVSTGLDALSHALESIWNINANPISDTYAVSAIEDILACLPALAADLENCSLRSRMALAALKAGLAFSNTKTALAHAISYEMTLRHGLPHGIACSFTLPMVLRLAWGADKERDAVLQRVFGAGPQAAEQRLRQFLQQLGVGSNFSDYGVTAEEAQQMMHRATQGVRGKNFIGQIPT